MLVYFNPIDIVSGPLGVMTVAATTMRTNPVKISIAHGLGQGDAVVVPFDESMM